MDRRCCICAWYRTCTHCYLLAGAAKASIILTRWRQYAPLSNTCFVGSTAVCLPNGILIGSAVFGTGINPPNVHEAHSPLSFQLMADCSYTLQWAATFPPQLPICMGDLDCHQIHDSLGPPIHHPNGISISS